MKISLDWLREYIDVPFTPEELDERLTMLGIEVESIENLAKKYDKIVVGEVLEVTKHPNADKLHLTRVSIGSGEPLHIVCGAPNVRAGMRAAVALVGADFGGGFVIKKSKIRGEVSEGMLCSERELGLSEDHSGLWELPDSYKIGTPLAEAMGKSDVVLEIGVTPNRPDCLSHIGIAREITAITKQSVKMPAVKPLKSEIAGGASVTIDAPDLCPRYAGRLVRGVTVAPSPDWLRKKLEAVGLRPINNIVDVTNFVLMETGHPLHAFDYKIIKDEAIVVRRAKGFAIEFTTLDGKRRKLDPDTLLIADNEKPLAIAGIMGGENSEISDSTRDVFIESAYFTPSSIRKSSKQLGLSTDASYRFERGTDIENLVYALDRATQLIAELGGGKIAGERIDEYPKPFAPKTFQFRPKRAEALIGMSIDGGRMMKIFNSLNIGVADSKADSWLLTAPSYRVDLEREEDAIEELARVIGYGEIPTAAFERMPLPDRRQVISPRQFENEIRSQLIALGATECVSSPLVADKEAELFDDQPVEVMNPLNVEMNRMRTSIALNLLDAARRNERFGADGQRLFEIGNVFAYRDEKKLIGKIDERTEIGILLTGVQESKSPYNAASQKADSFYARSIAEQLLRRIGVSRVESMPLAETSGKTQWQKAASIFDAAESIAVSIENKILAIAGKISAPITKRYDLRASPYVVLIDYTGLFELVTKLQAEPFHVAILPKYPAIERDLAITLKDHISARELLATVEKNVDKQLLESLRVFDEFKSPEMKQKSERSLAVRLVLRSKERTLEESEVDTQISAVLKALESTFGARLR